MGGGLNCATPSYVSWPIIRDVASYYITIDDIWSEEAMYELYENRLISGESGAAGLAALKATRFDRMYNIFDKNSNVLLINTENNTDPISYNNIITRYNFDIN